jgi:hypothetical protein
LHEWAVSFYVDRLSDAAAIDFRPRCIRVSLTHKTHLNAEFPSIGEVAEVFGA